MPEYIVRETCYPGHIKQEVVGELVRCKDCVHWDIECDTPQYKGSNICYMNEIRTKANDFCSFGERKDNE